MTTTHLTHIGKAQEMSQIGNDTIDLIVTSPPYPMIEMWDEIMGRQNPLITTALKNNDANTAFELMHQELDKIWSECYRVLKEGGIACINIGDATRTINNNFCLYTNHARIINYCLKIGFTNLPNIIWRKQTNAPNKFMGSGMLPAGAYVTLEHEWILIFRKGGKRQFKTEKDKVERRSSSFFWEERNIWFSDIWDLKGTKQRIDNLSRDRSAAFPFALPYRLINMYSVKGDTVLDPFMGTGTTAIAAIVAGRNSIGYEIDSVFKDVIHNNIKNLNINILNNIIKNRLENHKKFIKDRSKDKTKNEIKHFNHVLSLPVITSQETGIEFSFIDKIIQKPDLIEIAYTIPISKVSELPFKTIGSLF
jgi:DNA modification methylase|nr:site-specific DNA-methyltransferase [Alistipes onderdonkii]